MDARRRSGRVDLLQAAIISPLVEQRHWPAADAADADRLGRVALPGVDPAILLRAIVEDAPLLQVNHGLDESRPKAGLVGAAQRIFVRRAGQVLLQDVCVAGIDESMLVR